MYSWLIYFAVHLKVTQHCKSTILQLKLKKKKKLITTYGVLSVVHHAGRHVKLFYPHNNSESEG